MTGPTPATIAQALAATLAAHPACPPLKWAVNPDPFPAQPHLDGYALATLIDDNFDPEDQVDDRIAIIRTWARALRTPIRVTGRGLVTLTVAVTLPGGVRLEVSESVYGEDLPADLAHRPDIAEPLPF